MRRSPDHSLRRSRAISLSSAAMTSSMLFMSYTPRADSEARGYDDWLRAVDNPFFNAQAAIAHYTNWKLIDGVLPGEGATHFDFMLLNEGASPGDLFGEQAVQEFVGAWTQRWGREPDGPPERNCACCLLALDGAPQPGSGDKVALAFDAPNAADETWRLAADLIGRAAFQTVGRRFLPDAETGAPQLRAQRIAAP